MFTTRARAAVVAATIGDSVARAVGAERRRHAASGAWPRRCRDQARTAAARRAANLRCARLGRSGDRRGHSRRRLRALTACGCTDGCGCRGSRRLARSGGRGHMARRRSAGCASSGPARHTFTRPSARRSALLLRGWQRARGRVCRCRTRAASDRSMVSVVAGSAGELFSGSTGEAVTDRRCDSTSPAPAAISSCSPACREERIHLSDCAPPCISMS